MFSSSDCNNDGTQQVLHEQMRLVDLTNHILSQGRSQGSALLGLHGVASIP